MITARLKQSHQDMNDPLPARGKYSPSAHVQKGALNRFATLVGLLLLTAMEVAAQTPNPPLPSQTGNNVGHAAYSVAKAQEVKLIQLSEPKKNRGLAVMEALAMRASTYDWSSNDLLLQDLSDLLWAANGINRPASKGRTAPSAVDAQDVDIYVFLKSGAYLYDANQHLLHPMTAGDHRAKIDNLPPGSEPTALFILVSDISRFKVGTQEEKLEWAALDSGIVSQNISLFCAATGLGTRPRTDMSKDLIKSLLKLKTTQVPILNQAVGYPKGGTQ